VCRPSVCLRVGGIRSSPAFLREPEGNGCSERFTRTLKEQLLWVERFASVEELRLALLAFKDRYNREWLIQRHGHRSPSAVRAAFTPALAA
jgi:putative transposase